MKESEPNFDHKEIVHSGFGMAIGEKGECVRFDLSVSTLAFLLQGKVTVSFYGAIPQIVEAGNMGIFPVGRYHKIKIEEDCVSIFLFIIGDSLSFCRRILPDKSIQNMHDLDSPILPLPIKSTLIGFTEQIKYYVIHNQHFNADISEIKQNELQALLYASYTQEELMVFLEPLCKNYSSFFGKVTAMADQFMTINGMADALHMSRSAFLRRFKHTFQRTPKQWSDNIRVFKLERALRESYEPFAHIAQRLKFASQQHMNTFCSRKLGASPMEIRLRSSKQQVCNTLKKDKLELEKT